MTFEQFIAGHQLRTGDREVLQLVFDLPMRTRDIRQRTGYAPNWITRVCDRLIQNGLLCQMQCKENRRQSFYIVSCVLTETMPAYDFAMGQMGEGPFELIRKNMSVTPVKYEYPLSPEQKRVYEAICRQPMAVRELCEEFGKMKPWVVGKIDGLLHRGLIERIGEGKRIFYIKRVFPVDRGRE